MAKKGSVSPFRGKYRAFIGRRYLGVFESEIDAWKEIDGARDIIANQDKIRDTLRFIGERWFRERDEDHIVRDIRKEISVWKRHVETAKFIDYPVKAIRPKHLAEWLRVMSKKEAVRIKRNGKGTTQSGSGKIIGQATIRRARVLLNGVLKFAIQEGLINSNPMADIVTPKKAKNSNKIRVEFLTSSEIDRLFALNLTDEQRAIYAVAIYCGLRAGEIWGLRWENVHLEGDNPRIEVRNSYRDEPKTAASVRDIPLFNTPREALRRWKKSNGTIRGIGLVFPSQNGGCYSKGFAAKWFDKCRGSKTDKGIRSLAEIDRDVHFHDLRHTFASHLVMGDWGRVWSLYEVKEVLGHTSVSVTERYAHLSPDNIAAAAKQMTV